MEVKNITKKPLTLKSMRIGVLAIVSSQDFDLLVKIDKIICTEVLELIV